MLDLPTSVIEKGLGKDFAKLFGLGEVLGQVQVGYCNLLRTLNLGCKAHEGCRKLKPGGGQMGTISARLWAWPTFSDQYPGQGPRKHCETHRAGQNSCDTTEEFIGRVHSGNLYTAL